MRSRTDALAWMGASNAARMLTSVSHPQYRPAPPAKARQKEERKKALNPLAGRKACGPGRRSGLELRHSGRHRRWPAPCKEALGPTWRTRMATREMIAVDGNEAAASVAHRLSEVIAIYPITPSSTMGEWSDEWSAQGTQQHLGHRAGRGRDAVRGRRRRRRARRAAGRGARDDLHGLAGPAADDPQHVQDRRRADAVLPCTSRPARVATHALSIFGDHSDVMACRQTGFAMLASGSVQEAHDFAAIAHAATLEARVPFLHFFDGFRTSHEVRKIELLTDDDLRFLMRDEMVAAHRQRALTPDRPVLRGTAQNPDVFFQAREACNPFYDALPGDRREDDGPLRRAHRPALPPVRLRRPPAGRARDRADGLGGRGRRTRPSSTWSPRGEKVGVLKVRLYRPFSIEALRRGAARRACARSRCSTAPRSRARSASRSTSTWSRRSTRRARRARARSRVDPLVIGGRYGLSSKEFTPAMVQGGVRRARAPRGPAQPLHGRHRRRRHATPRSASTPTSTSSPTIACARVFFGLGADGTVGANKNSIKIIGEETDNDAQGYFVYDSKKSGAITISHLRFGPRPDPLLVPDPAGQLRRLPPVRLPRALRRARVRGAGRHLPAELAPTRRPSCGSTCRARSRSRSSRRSSSST